LAERYEEFGAAGAEILAVVNDTVEDARAYFEEHGLAYPCACDPEHEVYDRYGVASKASSLGQRPGLFVIDRDGVIRFAHVGRQQWEIPGTDEVLEVCRTVRCEAAPRPDGSESLAPSADEEV